MTVHRIAPFQRVAYCVPFGQVLLVLRDLFELVFSRLRRVWDFAYHIMPSTIHLTISLHGVPLFLVGVFTFELGDRCDA